MSAGAEGAGAVQAHSIRRNSLLSLATQVGAAAFTAVLTIFLARRLGAGGYGVFSLALGIAGLVSLPSDFGISNSVARFVAEHRSDRQRVQAVVADGLRLKLLIALVIAGLLAGLAGPIAASYRIPALAWPIRGVALALLGESVMMVGAVFTGVGRVDQQLKVAVTESAVELTASVGLVLAGAGATGAAFGRGVGYMVGAAVTLTLVARVLGAGSLPRSLRFGQDMKRIAGYAGVLLIVDGAYTAFNQIDVLIIGAYAGTRAVGIFSAPMKLTAFLAYPGSAVSSGVAPRLARNRFATPDVAPFLLAVRLLLILQAGIAAFVVGWAGLLVQVGLGSKYHASAAVLRALGPYVFLGGFGPLVSITVNYLGEARRRLPIAIMTFAINIGVDLLLVPKVGAIGGAWGTDAAYSLYAPAHLYICQRVLGIDLRPALRSLVRSMTAGGAALAVLLACGGSLDHLVRTIAGGAGAIVAFALALFLTQEVTVDEARAILRVLSATRRRSTPV